MKINIGVGLRQSNDWDIIIDPSGINIEPVSYWNIPCDNNEAECIKVDIDYISYLEFDNYLQLLLSKLRLQGSLIIYGTNLNEINRQFFMGNINDEQYNTLVYNSSIITLIKKSLYTPSFIRNKLSALKIINTNICNYNYYIEARRE